jgi:hypothetical protein
MDGRSWLSENGVEGAAAANIGNNAGCNDTLANSLAHVRVIMLSAALAMLVWGCFELLFFR